jgi:hypothetical protein
MKRIHIKRHNELLRLCLDAIERGDRGRWLLTGDLPGYELSNHTRHNELAQRLPGPPLGQNQNHEDDTDSEDDGSDSESDVTARVVPHPQTAPATTEADPTPSSEQARPLLSAKILRRDDLEWLARREIQEQQSARRNLRAPRPTLHNQFIPAVAFPLTLRPDGILYDRLSRQKWFTHININDTTIHLIECFVSSAKHFEQKKNDKIEQYKHIKEWLRLMGYTKVELHLLPFTYEGPIPRDTKEALRKLGVRPPAWKLLKIQLERKLIQYAISTKWLRRKLESQNPYKKRSGYVRYKEHRKSKRRRLS